MASQKRRFNFQGSDQEYIAYLESLLLDVRDAYRAPLSQPYQPSRPSPASPPSPPFSPSLSPTDVGDEVIDNFKGDDVSTNSLKLVWYQPPKDEAPHCSKRGAKRKRPEPDWERVMDKMVSEIAAKDWSSRRREVGLSTDTGIIAALDWIIYGARSQGDTVATKTDPSVSLYRPSDAVLHLMSAFATTTAALEVETTFTSQMFSFRVFVFVSLCCVAIHNGAKLEHINEIMRKCVSDSSEKNLTRLRKGALWVNRMMFELSEDGFGHSAYEVFVLWGGPLCQYGKFAEAGNLSISYFKSRILQHKPEIEIQAPLPFWVPFIIQTIVGNVFSLSSICAALGYDTDSPIVHDCPRYSEIYRNRQLPLPRPPIPGATASSDLPEFRRDGGDPMVIGLPEFWRDGGDPMISGHSDSWDDQGSPILNRDLELYVCENESRQH